MRLSALLLILAAALAGCLASADSASNPTPEISKVSFPLHNIRPDGLRGPPDGLRSVAYEFCVPKNSQAYEEVRRIDPSLKIYPASAGRIGCAKNQSLCIGETHQPHWHDVLQELAALAYISEIRESFFE